MIKKYFKKHFIMSFFISLSLAVFLTGCTSLRKTDSVDTGMVNRQQSSPAGQSVRNNNDASQAAESPASGQNNPMPMTIDQTKNYTAILSTDAGEIEIELTADKTPITVNNFVSLAKQNFYDNTIFHRTIKGFMIQGGDPLGDGTGGPGYRFDDEPFEGEYSRGTVAMANAGPNTNGSQFFIMHADRPLPKNYVIFGKVTNGLDVVDKIAEAEVEMSPSGEMSKPVAPVKVNSIQIIEN